MARSRMLHIMAGCCAFLATATADVHAAGQAPQPSIITRSQWGARAPNGTFGTTGTYNRATIHHTANAGDFNVANATDSAARVRGTQNYHMDVLGWSDIGYHFLADKFGNKFEGLYGSLGSGTPRGAHDAINDNSIGVCQLGWFDAGYNGDTPQPQRNAVYDIIAWKIPNPFTGYGSSSYGGYSNIGYVLGHYQVSSKTCPGTYNQPRIGTNFYGGEARNEINARIVGSAYTATYVSNTFAPSVETNQLVTVSVTFQNSGSATWNANTKLGTSNARDRNSAFYNAADWASANRATIMDQASVAPGQNGTFTFIAKAPSTTGSYQENFELVQEGVTWFEGTSDNVIWYVDVVAPPPYRAQYVSNSFVPTLQAGATASVSVTYKNTGSSSWDANTRLGTENPRDRNSAFYNSADWPGPNRPTGMDQASVAPGANGTFTFIGKAPATTGDYQEYFRLVQEGVSWFDNTDPVIWYVTVTAPPTPTPSPSPSPSPSASPSPTPSPSPSPSPTPTVTPSPTPIADIIIDNTSANVTWTGSWLTGTSSADKYGADYRYATSGSGAQASYRFNPTTPGTYRIWVYYPQGANRANNAPHRVDHYSGATSYNVNQQTSGGTWVALGNHYFNTVGYVVVRTTGANPSVVMADAVKVTYVGP